MLIFETIVSIPFITSIFASLIASCLYNQFFNTPESQPRNEKKIVFLQTNSQLIEPVTVNFKVIRIISRKISSNN